MPRYFFHLLHPDREAVRDDEGIQLANDAAAQREALASLGDLVSDSTRFGNEAITVGIEVVREGVGVIHVLSAQLTSKPQT